MSSEFLSQGEVDALLEGVPADADASVEPADAFGARPYDLCARRPLAERDVPGLDAVHDRLARLLRGALSALLHTPVEPVCTPARTMTYGQFSASLATPTGFNVLDVKPLHGRALLALDATLVHQVVDALFGGAGRFPPRLEAREFTFTERRTIDRLVFLILDEYEKAWKDTHPLSFALSRFEFAPPFTPVADADDPVLVTTFTLPLGASTASFHLCLPCALLEPIRARLEGSASETVEPDGRWLMALSRQVQAAEVDLVTDLVSLSVTVQQLLTMRVGDILSASIPEVLTAAVDGIPIFQCRYGTSNGRYAIRVQKVMTPEREVAGDFNA